MKSSASLPAAFTVCTTEAPSGYLLSFVFLQVKQSYLVLTEERLNAIND